MKNLFSRTGDDRGQILLLTAFAMVALLGMAAFALDASFMYDKRNRLYAAADSAAKSGAIEVHRNPSISLADLQTYANAQVTRHGFTPGVGTTVVVNHGPASGPYAGSLNYVEVIVSEPTSTFVGTVLGLANMTPAARAVAGTSPGENCIVTLNSPGATPPALQISNSTLAMPNCNVASAGDLSADNPNTSILAAGTSLAGTCSGSAACDSPANLPNLSEGGLSPTDPLAALVDPTDPGGCVVRDGLSVIPTGCHLSIINAPSSMTFAPGPHYIKGPVIIGNNVTITGAGVLLYFAGTAPTGVCDGGATAGCIDVGNFANWTLSTQTSGPYTGILMFQAATNHLNAQFYGNNPTYNLSGAMYFPGADVSFRNGLGASNDCMLFVARSLEIKNGNGSFSNTCAAYGGSPILTVSMAE